MEALAVLVLTWDTGTQSRIGQIRRVVAGADTSGDDTAGLVEDLGGYVPSGPVWQQLTRYRTRQSASIAKLSEPGSWAAIVAANRARFGDRMAAFTVQALRRRAGIVDGVATASVSEVRFTLFVICPHRSRRYRLVRLSQLGDPLP